MTCENIHKIIQILIILVLVFLWVLQTGQVMWGPSLAFFQECYSARELATRLFQAANSWLNGPNQGIKYVYLKSNL